MTTAEAAEKLGVSKNAVQVQCLRWGHRKIKAPAGGRHEYVYDISEDELHLFRFAMRRAIQSAKTKSSMLKAADDSAKEESE